MSRALDELLNRAPNRQAPYVGESAFATKAGIHASAIAKAPETYEHVPPETVGNRRRVLVSDQAGKSNLLAELQRIGVEIGKDDRRLDALLDEIKEREAQGYAYEAADASFELLARRRLGSVPGFSRSRASGSWSSTGTMRSASWSPSRRPSSRCGRTARA
jgi:2-isopropylmalate synthase